MANEAAQFWSRQSPYEGWIESLGLPVHKGYYIEDPRKLELGWWKERQCAAAFLSLTGQEGVTGAYVTEIAPGKTLPPSRGFSGISEKVEDRARDQIEYPDEDPWVRQRFEGELAKGGLKSLMPEEAYRNKNFEWAYAEGA